MQSRNLSNSQGFDCSKWQGAINWQQVATSNVKFVFIKATESNRTVDANVDANYNGAKSIGLPLGFYHFAHVTNDPISEAQHYLSTIANYKVDLWHVLDLENGSLDSHSFTKEQVSKWARQWLNYVEQTTGKIPMIYTGASFAKNYFEADFARYPLWIAQYGADKPMDNQVWGEWTVFQYSESSHVAGINGNVDLNELNGDIAAFLNNKGDDFDMDKVLDYPDWAWAELDTYVGNAYNDGSIKDWYWVQCVRDKQLQYKELLLLKVLIDERRRVVGK